MNPGSSNPGSNQRKSAAYRAGQVLGVLIIVLAILAACVAIKLLWGVLWA